MNRIPCLLLVFALVLAAAPDANVTGKWSGTFVMTQSDGQTKDSTALLILKQTGLEISGTVGPHEGEQHAITKGRIEGEKITLESADGGMSITFNLSLAGERITGDVSAVGDGRTLKAKLDVTRVK
jgi:hypothetical protein